MQRSASGGGRNRQPHQHEVPEAIPVTPQMYQRLTAKIAGKPEERILSYLMLRSLKQARYSEQNEGHFALASPCYTHFTSPIRRYPDLIVHRLLRELLQAGADPNGGPIRSSDPQPWGTQADSHRRSDFRAEPIPQPELAAIAAESSQAERRADDAERELMEWKKMRFMEDRVGEDFSGIILSCTKYGFFVELDDLFIEGLVPLASLSAFGSDDRFVFRDTDKQIVSTRGSKSYRMGQRVQVLLDRIDRQQKRLQFALIPEPQESGSLRKGKAARQAEAPAEGSPKAKFGKTKSRKSIAKKEKAERQGQEGTRQVAAGRLPPPSSDRIDT